MGSNPIGGSFAIRGKLWTNARGGNRTGAMNKCVTISLISTMKNFSKLYVLFSHAFLKLMWLCCASLVAPLDVNATSSHLNVLLYRIFRSPLAMQNTSKGRGKKNAHKSATGNTPERFLDSLSHVPSHSPLNFPGWCWARIKQLV